MEPVVDGVDAVAAVDDVGPVLVGAALADELVVARAAADDVGAGAAGQLVVAVSALEDVVHRLRPAAHLVVAGAALDDVGARGLDVVVAGAEVDLGELLRRLVEGAVDAVVAAAEADVEAGDVRERALDAAAVELLGDRLEVCVTRSVPRMIQLAVVDLVADGASAPAVPVRTAFVPSVVTTSACAADVAERKAKPAQSAARECLGEVRLSMGGSLS